MPEYDVRWYRNGDVGDLVSLRNLVWDDGVDERWFRWKYLGNDLLDHVPIVVAETGGEVVAMRGFVPHRIRDGTETEIGLLQTDAIVHPDHRRRGLFTRTTERAIDRYADGKPAFSFGHSNAYSRPGNLKMGWSDLGPRDTWYRVHDAYACLVAFRDDPLGRTAGRLATRANRLYQGLRERGGPPDADASVKRSPGLAWTALAGLHARRRPDTLHPVRDERFYRRYAAVSGDRIDATYLARRGGDAIAGVSVVLDRKDVGAVAAIVDLEPQSGGSAWRAGLTAILDRLLTDYRDVAYVEASDPFPPSVLRSFGFLPTDSPPLSYGTPDTDSVLHLTARPLDDRDPEALARRLRDGTPYLWSLAGP